MQHLIQSPQFPQLPHSSMARYPSLVTGSLLWLSTLAGLSVSQDWTLDPQRDLGQIANHMSALIGNTIYIIGGTAYYWAPQSVPSSERSSNNGSAYIIKTSNSYLRALDLSNPINLEPQFSDQTEVISELPFEIPHIKRGAFWVEGNIAYYWGGELEVEPVYQNGAFQKKFRNWPDPMKYYTYDLREPKLLGTWNTVSISTGSGSRSDKLTVSPASGGVAYSPEARKGFYLGGTNLTRAKMHSYPVSGMAVFDLESKVWKNETTIPELNDILEGQMVYVKEVGDKGILVAMGGNNRAGDFIPFDRVYVYDIAAKKWYRQETTSSLGNGFPEGRQGAFCAGVVAAPDKSSFTIYIYGGSNVAWYDGGKLLKGTWALTMPLFQWLPVGSSGEPADGRYLTTCHVIGGRMAMVRGRTTSIPEMMDENGGSFFYDMTNLTWSKRYTPAEYTVPKVIYDIIGGNGQGGASAAGPHNDQGFSDGLGRLFAAAKSSTPTSPTHSATTLPAASPPAASPPRGPTKSNTGQIAGGVVGGVVGAALVGVGIWMFRRRRRADSAMVGGAQEDQPAPSYGAGEIDDVPTQQMAHELGSSV